MIEQRSLAVGTRVALQGSPINTTLTSTTGRIVRPDVYDGYYVIRLDAPAYYHDGNTVEELHEIVDAADNFSVVSTAE